MNWIPEFDRASFESFLGQDTQSIKLVNPPQLSEVSQFIASAIGNLREVRNETT